MELQNGFMNIFGNRHNAEFNLQICIIYMFVRALDFIMTIKYMLCTINAQQIYFIAEINFKIIIVKPWRSISKEILCF